MSFLPINEENKEAPAGQTTNAPSGDTTPIPPQTGGSVGSEAGGAPPKTSASGTPTQFGSSASKLGDYLSANAPQINDQAETIAGNLGTQYGQAVGGIDQAVNQFGQQVKSGYTGFDQAAIDKAIQNAMGGQVGDQDIQAVQSQLNNQYGGPLSFESTSPYSQAQANAAQAAQNAQLLTTSPGINSYFQNNYQQESPGMGTLDTALLTSSPEAYGKVTNAAAPFSGLSDYLNTQTATANQLVPVAQQEVAQGKAYTGSALTAQEQAQQNAINQALAQAQGSSAAQNAAVMDALKTRAQAPSAAALSALGITQDQWNALATQAQQAATPQEVVNKNAGALTGTTDIDLTQFLQQGAPQTAFTAANVATPQDLARSQALQQLAGGQWSGNPLEGVSQVGGAPTNLNSFDYNTALSQATGVNQAQHAAAQAYVDALQAGMDEEHAAQQAAKITKAWDESAAFVPIPITVGAVGGLYGAGKNYYQNITSHDPKQIAMNVASMGMIPAGQAVVAGVTSAVNTIKNVFCFKGDTLVEMADGSTKEIQKVDLGDDTKGGSVLGTLQAYADDLYSYDGIEVSGKHAVKEGGRWIRIEDSKNKTNASSGRFKVFCLITSKHRIFSRGIEFADYVETDKYESLTIGESLDELNHVASLS